MLLVRSSFSYLASCHLSRAGRESNVSVIWLRGGHDAVPREVLADTFAQAIALQEPALVVDLGGVKHISGVTVDVIVGASKFMGYRSRPLVLRAPSSSVRQTFDIFGLSHLFDPELPRGARAAMNAPSLGWVAMPATGRVDWHNDRAAPEVNVREQTRVESAGAGNPLFARIP